MTDQKSLFDARDKLVQDFKGVVQSGALHNCSKELLKSFPVDLNVFFEKNWRKQPKVWYTLYKTAMLRAYMELEDGKE